MHGALLDIATHSPIPLWALECIDCRPLIAVDTANYYHQSVVKQSKLSSISNHYELPINRNLVRKCKLICEFRVKLPVSICAAAVHTPVQLRRSLCVCVAFTKRVEIVFLQISFSSAKQTSAAIKHFPLTIKIHVTADHSFAQINSPVRECCVCCSLKLAFKRL